MNSFSTFCLFIVQVRFSAVDISDLNVILGFSKEMWIPCLEEFQKQCQTEGIKTLPWFTSVDLRGHGDSSPSPNFSLQSPSSSTFHWDEFGKDVLTIAHKVFVAS